jgi:predicted protein tyrosine phosphatase
MKSIPMTDCLARLNHLPRTAGVRSICETLFPDECYWAFLKEQRDIKWAQTYPCYPSLDELQAHFDEMQSMEKCVLTRRASNEENIGAEMQGVVAMSRFTTEWNALHMKSVSATRDQLLKKAYPAVIHGSQELLDIMDDFEASAYMTQDNMDLLTVQWEHSLAPHH